MVISLVASKISLIFAPVIRQVKSGCGRDYFFTIILQSRWKSLNRVKVQ